MDATRLGSNPWATQPTLCLSFPSSLVEGHRLAFQGYLLPREAGGAHCLGWAISLRALPSRLGGLLCCLAWD